MIVPNNAPTANNIVKNFKLNNPVGIFSKRNFIFILNHNKKIIETKLFSNDLKKYL